MKEQCFDEGTMQAFLDGELSSDLLENVARHVALCDSCAVLLSEAEEESAFAFSVLDDELNSLVPTERIRAGVYQAISQIEEPKISFWQKMLGFVSALANPTVAALASLVIVFGIFAAFMSFRDQNSEGKYGVVVSSTQKNNRISEKELPMNKVNERFEPTPDNFEPEKVVYKAEQKSKTRTVKNNYRNPIIKNQLPAESIDGEVTYLKTIATLENTVNDKKDNVLRASSRISYERDMAVVNDSINRMKAEIKKNPKNEAAKQILRNSYQNKIELLNSVSERSEFMASLD